MSLLLDERRDSQRPTHLHLPAGKVASSGPDVVEFAASAGLILDDWQAWVLEQALSERNDQKWCAFEVALIVPRQNGKGSILEALEIYHLFVLRSKLITHSAHEFKTAREHFLRMQALIKGCPDLYDQVRPGSGGWIHTGAGSESIGTAGGARLNFIARSRGSGRGFTGDVVVLDEAYALPVEAVGAMGPSLSAMPNPQIWYTSSAPHADSKVLHGVRRRGLTQQGDRLFFAEWSNEPGVDIDDDDALAAANPAYPHRLSPDNIAAEREMLRELDDEFIRERLGVPSSEDVGSGVFGPGKWTAGGDKDSAIAAGAPSLRLALDVGVGMAWASFAAIGDGEDHLVHGELIERRAGTDWAVARALELSQRWDRPIAVDPKGPVSGLIDDLNAAGVSLLPMPDGQMATACSMLQKSVQGDSFRHRGQRELNDAVAGAAIRTVGDTWRWTRSGSNVDISALVALTVACWATTVELLGPAEYISLSSL